MAPPSRPPAVPQLPLALRYSPDQRLDTFIDPSGVAVAQVTACATGSSTDWLFLSGMAGTGKTHLLLGACTAALDSGARAAYLPLVAVVGRAANALAALEGMDLVGLDGIDALAGRRDDEVALFDFHNRARASDTRVIYSGTARPDALALVLPDLRSRLGQCVGVALSPLDDDGRRELLRQRAARRGLAMDDAALDWLLRRVGRDLASLTQLFERLDHAALAAQRRLTVPFLREVLGGEL